MDDNGMITESTPDGEWTYDPNEPRYCICNQVSYGDMVACDNEVVSGKRGFKVEFLAHSFFSSVVSVSLRVVPLSLRGHYPVAEGQMVLPAVHVVDEATGVQEDVDLPSCKR